MRCQRCCSPCSAAWRARCVFAAQTTERQTRVSGRRPKSVFAIWKYHEKKAQKHKSLHEYWKKKQTVGWRVWLSSLWQESLAKWNWYLCIYLHEHIQSVAHDRWHLDAPNQTLEELLTRVWFMLKLGFQNEWHTRPGQLPDLTLVCAYVWMWTSLAAFGVGKATLYDFDFNSLCSLLGLLLAINHSSPGQSSSF